MISVFQIFKIILGIVISAFILFFAVSFAAQYRDIGEAGRQVSLLVSFKKSIENVYTTAVEDDFDIEDAEILAYSSPNLITQVSTVNLDPIPIILVKGKKFSVYRNEYDNEWWKFYFIEVLPETKILFIPLNNDEKTWSVIGNITKFFPSTENTETKVKFYVGCNKTDTGEYYPLGERNKFMDLIPSFVAFNVEMAECENPDYFRREGYKIITISDELTDADFLVKPVDDEVGHVYIKTDDGYEEYVYKNGIDVVTLLLGGKKLYNYINDKFNKELGVAIDINVREADLLIGDYNINNRCGQELSVFASTLTLLKELIEKTESFDEVTAKEFNYYMRLSSSNYKTLESLGCG